MGQLRHDKEFPHTRSCHSVLLLLTSCISMACLLLSSCSVMADSATPWAAAHQVPLSFTICWSLLKLMSIESLMPSSHLILCGPLRLLSSIFSSVRIQCVHADSMCRIGLCNPRPARLLCPWASPGKNAGVGCHFLLQGIFSPRGRTQVSCVIGRFFLPSELPGMPQGTNTDA